MTVADTEAVAGKLMIDARFAVEGLLGEGASSWVFRVRERDGRVGALKVLRRPRDMELLRAEYWRLSQIGHPNLYRARDLGRLSQEVRIDDVHLLAGAPYLLSDFVDGVPPREALCAAAPVDRSARLLSLAEDLSQALACLHGQGLVHRDLKPGNVLVEASGRAVLLDIGLSGWEGAVVGAACGTVAFMAPEALGGRGDLRSDLYSLGATLFTVATGGLPFDGEGAELVMAILNAPRPTPSEDWLDPQMARLIGGLLTRDPPGRPQSARGVLAELARLRGDHDRVVELSATHEVLAPAFVGREDQITGFIDVLSGAGPAPWALVVGAAGSGKSALVAQALARYRMLAVAGRVPPVEVVDPCGSQQRARRGLGPRATMDDLVAEMADDLGRREMQVATLLHFADYDDPVARRLLLVLALADPAAGSEVPRLVVECHGEQADELQRRFPGRFARIRLDPLGARDLRDLMASVGGQAPTNAIVATVARLSAGLPALAIEVARRWAVSPEGPLDLPETAELNALVVRTRQDTPTRAREVADAVAVWAEPTPVSEVARLLQLTAEDTMGACAPLIARGQLRLSAEGLAFPSSASARAWHGAIPGAIRVGLHRRAIELSRTDPVGRAEHGARAQEAGDLRPLDHALLLEASQTLARRYEMERALALARLTVSAAPRSAAVTHLARLHLQLGQYDQALAVLAEHSGLSAEAGGSGALPVDSLPAEVLRAEVLQRRGDYDAAQTLLARVLPALEGGPLHAGAATSLGRLLLRRGQTDAALELCATSGASAEPTDAGLLEVCALACFYRGELEQTALMAQRGAAVAEEQGDPGLRARFESIAGMAAFRGGKLHEAAGLYGQALSHAREVGDAHATASFLGNLGSAEVELGRYDRALPHLVQAANSLRRLGRTADLALALCNLGGLMLLLGDLARVEGLAVEAEAVARAGGGGYPLAVAQMLMADLLRRQQRWPDAERRYRFALDLLDAQETPWERTLCTLGLADTLSELADGEGALGLIDELVRAPMDAGAAEDAQGRVALSRARGLLAVSPSQSATVESLNLAPQVMCDLAHACARFEARAGMTDLWRTAALLAALLDRAGREAAARGAASTALKTWEAIMENTPEVYREGAEQDPDAQHLRQRWESILRAENPPDGSADPRTRSPSAPESQRRLRRLLAINKRLNSELRLPELLEMVMDAAIELTNAERGFLLLTPDSSDGSVASQPAAGEDEMEVRVARNMDRRSLEGPDLAVSRSIAQRAARGRDPVVTVDAAMDERFREAVSVSNLHLRSVLAVPLLVKQQVVGTIYLDHRLRSDAFGGEDVALVQDLADQAAIAIENARLVGENERRQQAIVQLNKQLERRVESQALELSETREQLRSSRDALQIRYDYSKLVGGSAPMLHLFRLLDRVTETSLPVVIHGESGTGKELVARAVHHNGPRAEKPFVCENCAAIPDTLLESILFGAERGAFTGAERMRRGLFEIADGGSLLLDEVGEMSGAMQTKLLRVLQEGEFRRVGGERTIKTDVRVIAASNRDLDQLVQAGSFRRDLFYRLSVLRIELPTLRQRREDIPLLVRHFLEKHGADDSVRLTQLALARLVDHSWPGNVRELENELMRLGAMAGPLIDVADLSPTIGAAAGSGAHTARVDETLLDESLRERVEQLERDMIRRALEHSGGNQSQAARILGLSRYGLIKKIKRYYPDSGDPRDL